MEVRTAARLDTLMGEIRALGHIPRVGLVDESALALHLRKLKSRNLLRQSELAERRSCRGLNPATLRSLRHNAWTL